MISIKYVCRQMKTTWKIQGMEQRILSTLFLEKDAQSGLLVDGSKETDVRNCVFPTYDTFS